VVEEEMLLTLNNMGSHFMVDLLSMLHIINCQTYVGDTPFMICLSYVMIHLLTIGTEQKI
jgi:hypothetical protein